MRLFHKKLFHKNQLRTATFVFSALYGGIGVSGCGSSQPGETNYGRSEAEGSSEAPQSMASTTVSFLGTLHGVHLGSQGFSLKVVEETIRAFGPEVVLVEIPPDRFEASVAEVDALPRKATRNKVKDEWLKAFPELYAVVIPLRKELGYELHPVSGWQPQVSSDRQQYWKANPKGPKTERYKQAQTKFAESFAQNRGTENAAWVNGPEYQKLSGEMYGALSEDAEAKLGAAGVQKINEAHWKLVEEAVGTHKGKKILLVFGALHRWYLVPRLQALEDVRLVDIHESLPSEEKSSGEEESK